MPYHTKKKDDKPKMVVVVMKKKDAKMKPKKELSKVQKDLMKEIKSKHSKKHMDMMKKAMLSGLCFQEAHKMAMKEVGK
jgi:cytoplasmic iron level regulating protein YaaA (DUF328/UPF0246 family)